WAHSRVAVLTILVFVVLTTIATLVHIDRFHFMGEFADSGFIAIAAAWFWLAVYLVVPVLMLALLLPQERSRGVDPPPRHPIPLWLRIALAAESVVLTLTGPVLTRDDGVRERMIRELHRRYDRDYAVVAGAEPADVLAGLAEADDRPVAVLFGGLGEADPDGLERLRDLHAEFPGALAVAMVRW